MARRSLIARRRRRVLAPTVLAMRGRKKPPRKAWASLWHPAENAKRLRSQVLAANPSLGRGEPSGGVCRSMTNKDRNRQFGTRPNPFTVPHRVPGRHVRTFHLFPGKPVAEVAFFATWTRQSRSGKRIRHQNRPLGNEARPKRRAAGGEVARKRVAAGAQVREKVLARGSTCSFSCRAVLPRASNCVAPEETNGRLSARLASSMITLAKRARGLYLLSTNSLRRRHRASGAAQDGPAGKKRDGLRQNVPPACRIRSLHCGRACLGRDG
jgi:hypothetical protein